MIAGALAKSAAEAEMQPRTKHAQPSNVFVEYPGRHMECSFEDESGVRGACVVNIALTFIVVP